MSNNIKTEYRNNIEKYYVIKSTEDLPLPFLGFAKEEEAELAVAVAKTLKAHNKSIINLDKTMVYVFRILGIQNYWIE